MGKRGGKGGRGGRGGGRGGKPRDPQERDETKWSTYAPVDMVNENFETYYKAQNILSEAEWPEFMAKLKEELPTTFRVTGSREHAETIADVIKKVHVPSMQNVEHDGITYSPPEQIPWYPAQLAWQVSAPKRIIRKSPPFKKFQRFLVGETEVGNLSRQEAVSMIPPLLLDIEPHHTCLDMCAAPGSKTAQMIESLNPHHTASTGLLIANDSDYKRCHMLVHQTGRMPSKGLMVTNYDASIFPKIKLGKNQNLFFDRILADVPGDGTMRKNVEIWGKWSTSDGNGLHSLQLRILHRAMDILKPGGRMVYSTCSFNPVENEAVVAAALNSRKGFKIVDASSSIPHLKTRPGLTEWKVAGQPAGNQHGKDVVFFDSYEDAQEKRATSGNDQASFKETAPTYFAPVNAKDLGLEKCMRLVPHDQNTGGFFVCVLEKAASTVYVEPTAASESAESKAAKRAASPSTPEGAREGKKAKPDETEAADIDAEDDEDATEDVAGGEGAEKKEKKDWSYKEDPFSYIDPENSELQSIREWFSMKPSFPIDQMLVRNDRGEPLRVIYLTNALLKRVLEHNSAQRLRIVSAGVKAFVRQDSQNRTDIPCKWRIPADGVAEVLPHVGEGVVKDVGEQGMEVLRILVEHPYPMVEHFPAGFKEWAEETLLGNVLLRFPAGEGHGGSLPLPLVVPVWKAKTSLSLLIDKREKSSLSLRTFGEDIVRPPMNQDQKLAKQAEVAETGEETDVAAAMEAEDEEEMANAPAVGQLEEAAL